MTSITTNTPGSNNPNAPQAWRVLRLFFVFRLSLTLALSSAFFTQTGPNLIGRSAPALFGIVAVVYLGFIVSSGLLLLWRSPPAEQQAQFAVFIDILAITLLMHASGGIPSGLGLIIAISIANGSALMGGRQILLFAALASLAILTEALYADLAGQFPTTAYTQGGLLGVTFFAVALLAHALSSRLQESERLARQRGLDLANMAQVNDYVIQHMNTGVLVVDADNSIRMMNETAWNLLGRPAARIGSPLNASADELSKLVQAWRNNPATPMPAYRAQPGGRELTPELTRLGADAKAGTLIFLEDSDRITAHAQQMKLASLGRLTASIAHEIRNPLGAISHAGQLLAESPELNAGDRRLTEIIQNNSIRVNHIIETVLQLSRRQCAKPERIDLTAWLDNFAEEFRRSHIRAPNQLLCQLQTQGLQIEADPGQLRQVLGNLCENALKYAGDDSHPVCITLRSGFIDKAGDPVLDILDNGPGIAQQHIRQIFEPFFTTGSKSTGLGLYISKELCDIHKIDLAYLPPPDGGGFRLHFHNWQKHAAIDDH
jgi:two-component system sensor histidine kinase PilS (NtrC family)